MNDNGLNSDDKFTKKLRSVTLMYCLEHNVLGIDQGKKQNSDIPIPVMSFLL